MEAQRTGRGSIRSSEQSVVVIPRFVQPARHPEYGRWRWDSDFRELIQSSPAHADMAPRARARSSVLTTPRKSDVPRIARLEQRLDHPEGGRDVQAVTVMSPRLRVTLFRRCLSRRRWTTSTFCGHPVSASLLKAVSVEYASHSAGAY